MALRTATSAAVVGVAAGTINLSISDCGDSATHGHVSGLSPSSVPQGTSTLVSASGTLDTTIADGSFDVDVKAAGVTITTCTGNICGASSCDLPAGTGSVNFRGLACPVAAGDVSLDFDVTISQYVPSSLAVLEMDITAEGSGGKLMCAKINTSPADGESSNGSCSGSDDPVIAEPTCYQGEGGALGLTETVTVSINDFADGAGSLDFSGEGIIGFTCSGKQMTKSGQDISLEDSSDCLPNGVEVSAVKYCSDSDTIKITVKDKAVPLPVSAQLSKVACEGANSACSGSEDPVITEPTCYQGQGGALGLTETVTVSINDFADGAGSLDFSGDGIIAFTCSGKQMTKSGQDISLEDSSDCLPNGVEVSAVKYCSDSDTIKITVKDKAVPIPVSAQLNKVACSAVELEKVAVTGACTSDEQTALADPQDVGKKANDCGTTSYNIITGNFNHDKFNECFSSSIGISTTCAECYAATGEYGAKNCKADCLLGWCKSGCLSCTAPAQETLATCTGFPAATAEPCEEELTVV